MKFSVLSLIILASFVSAIPAPQRGGGNRGRPSASAATQAAATPAASQAGATSAAAAVSAPAVSTKASVAAGTTAAGGTTAGGAAGTAAAGTAPAGTAAAGTAPAGTAAAGTAAAGSGTSSGGTGHLITVNNNCGSGSVKWQRKGVPQSAFPGGSTTVNGDIEAAILWLDGYDGFTCGENAVNCGMVEFTLGPNGGFNSINYSLLTEGLGNHKLRAPMQIALAGGTCSAEVPGPCTGDSAAECPTGYTGTDVKSGKPPTCQGTGVGVLITFCP